MNNRHKTSVNIVFMVVFLSVCKNLTAADWTVEQHAVLTSPEVNLSQEDSTSSNQAINGVMLDLTTDSLTELNQEVTISGAQLTLTQSGAATNNSNVQAVNFVSAKSIDELTQSMEHTSGTATLKQDTAGTNNIQSVNYAKASGNINDASQTFVGQSLTLEKTVTTPAGNIQAVNYIEAASYTGELNQSVMLDSLTYSNLPGNAGGIRINSIKGDTSGILDTTQISQTVTVDEMTVGPSSDRTVVIINHMEQ